MMRRADLSKTEPIDRTGPASVNESPTRRQALQTAAAIAAGLVSGRAAPADAAAPALVDQSVAEELRTRSHTSLTPLKSRAIDDYRISTQAWGGQLASPPAELFACASSARHPQVDIAIIGSGYGAAISAARLAQRIRPTTRLCILERGREWLPGTFPDTFDGMNINAYRRMTGADKRNVANPLGLYNALRNDEVDVLSANGLGGTSLINASVVLRPDPDVFQHGPWPQALRDPTALDPYYHRAIWELGAANYRCGLTSKLQGQRSALQRLGPDAGAFEIAPLATTAVTPGADGRNLQGMIQRPCTRCGDCITGCNIGAKNTLAYNYLPMARRAGAAMYTQVEVRWIEKCDGFYRLHAVHHEDTGECQLQSRPLVISARMVIVAGGSPGSAEVLLRSRQYGLCLAPPLGFHWSSNGDMIGFVVDKCDKINIGGFGAYPPPHGPVGPTVQTSFFMNNEPDWRNRYVIQEAALPTGVHPVFKLLLADPNLDSSLPLLAMGHDGAAGRVELDGETVTIRWPGAEQSEYRRRIWETFERLAAVHNGRYKKLRAFGNNIVTAHPLGGCRMADDPAHGVVNDRGQVFDGRGGGDVDEQGQPAVHEGLYVVDASIVPSSLGVNPLLTISALAERIAELIPTERRYADLFV
jgi:cholesterol oxidase